MARAMSLEDTIVLFVFALAGCHRQEVDLAPIRDGLDREASIVCAQPASRPPHASHGRDVSREEARAALAVLVTRDDADAIETVHQALTGDRPVVGELRRFDLMLRATPVDLGELTADKNGLAKASAVVEAGAAAGAGLHVTRIERAFLAAAKVSYPADALARCADVVALERDRILVGSLTDMMLGAAMLDTAKRACIPIIDDAPPADRAAFAASLAVIKKGMPEFDVAFRRDRAEMMLYQFGPAFEPSHAFPCDRAREFANALRTAGASPDPRDLAAAWRRPEVMDASSANASKYAVEYQSKLQAIDEMLDHARR